MGEVWRAVHPEADVQVAIKLLRSDLAGRARFSARFQDEVAAVAALDHPNIVRVLDAGELEPEPGEHRGSPWLAMELAPAGALEARCGRLDWSQTRSVTLALLDGLAHAHARGVIHRDVKPANVLLMGAGGARVALSDFGLASRRDRPDALRHAGTAQYMAPEQRGGHLEQGPWTDLFAVGRLVGALLTGHPGVLPAAGIPRGLAGWIARMSAHDPRDRYRCVADAVVGLNALPEPHVADEHTPSSVAPAASTPTLSVLFADADSPTWFDGAPEVSAPAAQVELAPIARPAIPADPIEPVRIRLSPLPGTGLGLTDLRSPRLIGRDAVCRELWSALREVDATGRAAAVGLVGDPGTGRTAVGEWLARRASELGAAWVTPSLGSVAGMWDADDGRPVLVWADDDEAARRALEAEGLPDLPVLVVLTGAIDPDRDVAIEPLDDRAIEVLVRDLLGLDERSAAAVARLAVGSPRTATSLVADWVASDQVKWGVDGWSLRAEALGWEAAVGSGQEAVDALIELARDACLRDDRGTGLELFDAAGRALVATGVDDADPRWGQVELGRVVVRGYRRPDLARAQGEALHRRALELGWTEVAAGAARQVGRCAVRLGHPDEARRWVARALELSEGAGLEETAAASHLTSGTCEEAAGDWKAAIAHYERAAERYAALGMEGRQAGALVAIARAVRKAGQLAEAERRTREVREILEQLDEPHWLADAVNGQGEVARLQGDLDRAQAFYEEALRMYERLHTTDVLAAAVNLAMVEIGRGRDAEALDLAGSLRPACVRSGKTDIELACLAVEAVARARRGEWGDLDRVLGELATGLVQRKLAYRDYALMAGAAAEACERAGQTELAARARAVEAQQLDVLRGA